jgi:hypothetical protein
VIKEVIKKKGIQKIIWSDEKKKKLQNIGRSIRDRLNKISIPEPPSYPKEIIEALKIWDEE